MRRLLTILTAAAALTAITIPALADGKHKVEVEVEGYCIEDQNGTGLAYADFYHPGFASFTLNGQPVVGKHSGVDAQFGENTWTAEAKQGFKLKGDTEGTFTIPDCATPGTTTTTTVPETTTTETPTTTLPETTTTAPFLPEVVIEEPPVETTTTERLVELPFTGINPGLAVLAGLAALSLGGIMIRSARSDG